MLPIRRVLVVVASIVGLAAGTVLGETPKLEYKLEPGKTYGYEITITVDTKLYTQTDTGYIVYWGVSADDDRIALRHHGDLKHDRKKKDSNVIIINDGPMDFIPSGNLTIDRQGKPQRSWSLVGLSPLPHLLGYYETLVFEKLPAEPEMKWQSEEDFKMTQGRRFSTRKATERIDYSIAEVKGDLVRINKKYIMRSGESAANMSRARMEGQGFCVFDQRAGLVSSIEMDYTLLIKDNLSSETVKSRVVCRRMPLDRLDKLVTEIEDGRDRTTGEFYERQPKEPLTPEERKKLVRDLRSKVPSVAEAAVVRLITAPRDDNPIDFSVPLAKIVANEKSHMRMMASRALKVWGTPEAEEALTKASESMASINGWGKGLALSDAALEALGAIGTESSARAVAKMIVDRREKAAEVLRHMGPVAEVPLIEQFDDDDNTGGQQTACEILAEVGGMRSVLTLVNAKQRWTNHSRAVTALEAIAKRLGLSVEELLAKAESEADAAAAAARAAYRTWSDDSGQFQIKAQMADVADDIVTLRTLVGKKIDVPIKRLSQADRDFVAAHRPSPPMSAPAVAAKSGPKSRPKPRPKPVPIQRPTGEPGDTEILGDSVGGFPFRFVHRERAPLLGLQLGVGAWEDEQAVGFQQALFDRSLSWVPGVVVAKEGYAVGGLNVETKTYVTALEIIFMRQKPDGTLDPSDSYKSPCIGFPTGSEPKKLGGTGASVVGIHGRRGLILNAVGLVICEE